MKTINVTSKAQLEALYNQSALTWEGLTAAEENFEAVMDWLVNLGAVIDGKEPTFHIITGEFMNAIYGLKGSNAYADILTIVSVTDINQTKIALARFGVGGRWFSDIVDNNARREV